MTIEQRRETISKDNPENIKSLSCYLMFDKQQVK